MAFFHLSIARLLDPTLLLLVALGLALLAGGRAATTRARRARTLAWMAWAGLWLFSTPVVAAAILAATETRGPDLNVALAGQDREKVALVVLGGGGGYPLGAPTPRERLSNASALRAITAARLWQEQRFGTVVVSGSPGEDDGMADLMIALGVPADRILREDRSGNTRENAAFSAVILRERRVESVVVCTSASHLRRSLKNFAANGVHAIGAAADFADAPERTLSDWIPSSFGLGATQIALHEILGYVRG